MSETTGAGRPQITLHGKIAILGATAVALLATPLASPAMEDIAIEFAELAKIDPFAQSIFAVTDWMFGNTSTQFLIKFLMLSIPALFIIIGAPFTGWLCDRVGRKSLLIWSLVIFGVAGVSTYWAESFWFMFLGRAVLGLTIAAIKTATVAMVGDYFEGPERKKFIGIQGSAVKFGGLAFMVVGGYMAEVSWQTPFLGYLIAFLFIPSVMIALVETLPYAKEEQKKQSGDAPPVPFKMASFVFISATLASTIFFIAPAELRFYIGKDKFDLTSSYFGWAIFVGNGVGAVVAIWYNRFKNNMNYTAIYALIFGVMGVGFYLMQMAPGYYTSLIGLAIAGVGFGLYIPNQTDWILSFTAPQRRGLAIGIVTTAMFLGQFVTPFWVEKFKVIGEPDVLFVKTALVCAVLTAIYLAFALIEQKRGGWVRAPEQ